MFVKENSDLKEELKCIRIENNSNLAKADIYKKISNQVKLSFLGKINEICHYYKMENKALGAYINENLYQIFGFLHESIKEIMKKSGNLRTKYKKIKENLEGRIGKLQGNLKEIVNKFESVKGNFDKDFDGKITENQKLQSIAIELENSNSNLQHEIKSLKNIIFEKEKEIERQINEKKQLNHEIYEIEIKYKKIYVGLEQEMEKNHNLMKEIGNLNELLLKKNINENIKGELLKKMQKITKKF